MDKVNSEKLFDEPFKVVVVDEAVVVVGPDAVAIAFTPSAAEKSAEVLRQAAAAARQTSAPGPQVA